MPVTKEYIGWSDSLASSAAQQILEATKDQKIPGGRAIDLSKQRIIVPSQFAGRLIREQLALQSSHGVLLPSIETPESFLNWGDRNIEIANKETCLLAWIQVLMSPEFDRANYPHLFPIDTVRAFDFQGAQSFAQQLMELRDQLGGSRIAHSFQTVAEITKEESERWDDLAQLEVQYLNILQELDKSDHNRVRTALATGEGMPEGVETVWLVGLLDPQPLLLEALDRRKDHLDIKIIIGADSEDAAAFDNWGRPDTEFWKNRRSTWPDFEQYLHTVRDPEHGLDRLSKLLNNKKPIYGTVAIVPCERERYPAMIADRLHSIGAESLNPMGELHGGHAIHHCMHALCEVIEKQTFSSLRKALLHPTLTKNLLKQRIDFHKLNELLDALSQRKPPQELSHLLDYVRNIAAPTNGDKRAAHQVAQIKSLAPLLEEIVRRVQALPSDPKSLGQALLLLTQKPEGESDKLSHEFALQVSDTVEQTLNGFCLNHAAHFNLTAVEWINLTLSVCRNEHFRKSDVETPVNLPGWMEALWEPVPHLIIFGFTDDLIPRSNHSHPFLPARLRKELQLSTSDNHFANAAYSLERIRRCRSNGRVDIIVPRMDNEGNGLRPSRLLFQCANSELIQRVRYLFEDELQTEGQPFWNIPPELRLSPAAKPEQLARAKTRISATAFKNYLTNPADFWLKNVLQLNETTHDDVELDRAGFGTLIHAALEKFGRNVANHTLSDPDEIAKQLSQCLDEHFSEAFSLVTDSNEPENKGIIFQRETARDRLTRFAQLQARLVNEGWRIQSVEENLPVMEINGMQVGGRYDRLDYNEQTKAWRVYDYKSFNETTTPENRHFTVLRKSNMRRNPDFQFPSGIKNSKKEILEARWDDLQLPVYYHNLIEGDPRLTGSRLEVGYIILPSEGEAEACIWQDYELMKPYADAAIALIIERIQKASPEFFKFERNGTYPVFPNFSKRKPEAFMDITKLGTIEAQG